MSVKIHQPHLIKSPWLIVWWWCSLLQHPHHHHRSVHILLYSYPLKNLNSVLDFINQPAGPDLPNVLILITNLWHHLESALSLREMLFSSWYMWWTPVLKKKISLKTWLAWALQFSLYLIWSSMHGSITHYDNLHVREKEIWISSFVSLALDGIISSVVKVYGDLR